MVVSTVVTVVVLVVVFVGIFPKVADYSQAWSSIQQMPSAYVVALVVATVVNLAAYVWPLQMAAVGVLAIGVAVVAFAMVLRSERGARMVGRWADRLASPLTRRRGAAGRSTSPGRSWTSGPAAHRRQPVTDRSPSR